MPRDPARKLRIQARLSRDALAAIKRAAELQGRSVSEFVAAAAEEAARQTIEETYILRLTAEDQLMLAQAILNPPEPTPALRRAAERYRRDFKSF